MLQHTFCHIPGIGLKSERSLWSKGVRSWSDLMDRDSRESTPGDRRFLKSRIEESIDRLHRRDPNYFAGLLPANQQWRLFGDFRDSAAYLDIETAGLSGYFDYITTIALFDGESVFHYVRGENLDMFVEDIKKYDLIVTYNGKCFDIPVINRHFGINLRQAHIDLRYVLHGLGYRGGLKGCERQLGLCRDELEGVDGYCAVLLWHDYVRNENHKALETLLAYNILDAVNLETLMVVAYNLKLEETPFRETHELALPEIPPNPFEADPTTINRIMELRY